MAQKRKEITNHREIERIVHIHNSIASGKYPNTRKLAEKLECSTSTISRDIEFLRDRCDAPCNYDSQKCGYYYTDSKFQLVFSTEEKNMDVKIADTKKSFAEYLNIPISILDKTEEISNLQLSNQTELQANLSCKYVGRYYGADFCTWAGLKYFKYAEKLLFCVAIFEDYHNNPKYESFKLQGTKQDYISEYNAYDNGYWHYIIVEQDILETKTEVARKILLDFIKFMRGVQGF